MNGLEREELDLLVPGGKVIYAENTPEVTETSSQIAGEFV